MLHCGKSVHNFARSVRCRTEKSALATRRSFVAVPQNAPQTTL
jgi:hypothetical protein